MITLVPGNWYKLRYRLPGQQKLLEALMQYLGEGMGRGELVFNARPKFGSQTMMRDWLVEAEERPKPMPDMIYLNRPVR